MGSGQVQDKTKVALAELIATGKTPDGKEAKGLSADFLVRAVAVPAGRHEVTWEFHDPAFETGLRVSIGAFVLILLLLGASYVHERRQRKQAGSGGASTPAARISSTTAGTSSRWLPDRIDRPTRSGSSSRATAAIWAGVRRMPS